MRGRLFGSTFGSILLVALATGCATRAPQSALASDANPNRIELNRFVEYFSVRVERAADDIVQHTDDPSIARNSVYWKMRAIPAAQAALLLADNQAAAIQLWVLSTAQPVSLPDSATASRSPWRPRPRSTRTCGAWRAPC